MFIFVLAYDDIFFHLLCLDWSSLFMFLNLHFLGEYFGSLNYVHRFEPMIVMDANVLQ